MFRIEELEWMEIQQPPAKLRVVEISTALIQIGVEYSECHLLCIPGRRKFPHYERIQKIYDLRSLRAFPITETELKLIAAAPIIGFKRSPNAGYNTPAATGTPIAL